mmetsp:Transcript_46387/g.121740  ORF Transcript_46387/g.121740 Transcript_46387/m.121740 type:complete len:226 (+) Transcript_46387:235-912(+)
MHRKCSSPWHAAHDRATTMVSARSVSAVLCCAPLLSTVLWPECPAWPEAAFVWWWTLPCMWRGTRVVCPLPQRWCGCAPCVLVEACFSCNAQSLLHAGPLQVSTGGFKLNVWDIGGQKHIRPYWKNYYENTDALIYVIDSADRRRIDEAAEELSGLADEEALQKVPILVLANKQDLLNAMTAAELMQELGLTDYKDRWIQCLACSAKTGENLQESIAELLESVQR